MTLSTQYIQDNNILITNENGINVSPLKNNIIPSGIIAMWFSEVIPKGWILCNGLNGTPNMSKRFPLGWGLVNHDLYPPRSVGGSETVSLNINTIPKHTHTINSNNKITEKSCQLYNNGIIRSCVNSTDSYTNTPVTKDRFVPNNNQSMIGNNQSYLSDKTVIPHNNMPPYIVLNFIMKL